MVACPTCGHDNVEGAKFCNECATPLRRVAPPRAEERKVVSVLFCDLVGFTASSESADPEDVRARLRPYHELLRTEIQRYGGTVEKFIGDAVMAVFGAPVAHEDDPERAVRAGLRILDAIDDLNAEHPGMELHVRIGINTGEGIVAMDARPELGEGLVTGDVVNTASRLQGVAPIDGVGVGEATYEATRHTFDYEELPRADLKGKAEPVRLFHAKAARARFGSEVVRQHETPLVGREIDLAILRGAFDKTVAANAVQLVTIVGEPGVGKSRLVAELDAYIDAIPDLLVRIRKGRCLPYGEGITFWALGEIVKWEAGILESDAPDVAAMKLDAIVPDEVADAPWLRQRLRPLAGLDAPSAAREENFTGWRRFLELLAEDGPTIAVFEDLHWADDALLDFIEHVADFAQGVPLLLVGTARPELHERAEGWGGHLRNASTINLTPLTETETARLISNLLEQAVLPVELQQTLIDRAGGNPLYAEEFVRLLKDRGVLEHGSGMWRLDASAEIPVPTGVQGLIAARLDTLTPEQKSLLQDAAVVGKVFWAGAIAEIGVRDPGVVERDLHDLSRRELVQVLRRSSVEGEREFTFWHALVRDVAYGQIPRALRADKHVAAARWIERLAGDRADDHAEILAAHYLTALDLVPPDAEDRAAFQEEAIRHLSLAGDRAIRLDIEAAERDYERALALLPPDDPRRPRLLARHAEAAFLRARFGQAAEEFEEAIAALRGAEEELEVARALIGYHLVLSRIGNPGMREAIAEAVAILERGGPSAELVDALAYQSALFEITEGSHEAAIAVADRAIDMARLLDLPEPPGAVEKRGLARVSLGEPGGFDDLTRAVELASSRGLGREVDVINYNHADVSAVVKGPREKLVLDRRGLEVAAARGNVDFVLSFRQAIAAALVDLGEWDDALELAEALMPDLEAAGDQWDLMDLRNNTAIVALRRGRVAEAQGLIDLALPAARENEEPQILIASLTLAAAIAVARGDQEVAAGLLGDVCELPFIYGEWARYLPEAVRASVRVDDALAERIVEMQGESFAGHAFALLSARATLDEARRAYASAEPGYREAAARWGSLGVVFETGQALLGLGRVLVAQGRAADADDPLREARAIFASLRATPSLAETDALLAKGLEQIS
jgi:class 3 adenylate cyclase/tetratricopeptide (TPR) repeat protein